MNVRFLRWKYFSLFVEIKMQLYHLKLAATFRIFRKHFGFFIFVGNFAFALFFRDSSKSVRCHHLFGHHSKAVGVTYCHFQQTFFPVAGVGPVLKNYARFIIKICFYETLSTLNQGSYP
jgi:hypothetical protein